jgi:hypothetical protein
MKRKRRIETQEIFKRKARLNFNGSTMIQGQHYDESYAPVVTWPATRYFLAQSILRGWHTRQMDFVLAYTQAGVERDDLYMEIPKGVSLEGADSKLYVLHMKQNLYGMKQAGRVWNQHLVTGMLELGFKQSSVDDCVLYFNKSTFLVYTDDSILMGPDNKELDHIVALMKSKFNLEVEGNLCDYLGINIRKREDGALEMTQPQLIRSIIEDLGLNRPGTKTKTKPALILLFGNLIILSYAESCHVSYTESCHVSYAQSDGEISRRVVFYESEVNYESCVLLCSEI